MILFAQNIRMAQSPGSHRVLPFLSHTKDND